MYSARTKGTLFIHAMSAEPKILYDSLIDTNPAAWEQIGWVMHFISEITTAHQADLLDPDLARRLFGTTLVEWTRRLRVFDFPQSDWYLEFGLRLQESVDRFGAAQVADRPS